MNTVEMKMQQIGVFKNTEETLFHKREYPLFDFIDSQLGVGENNQKNGEQHVTVVDGRCGQNVGRLDSSPQELHTAGCVARHGQLPQVVNESAQSGVILDIEKVKHFLVVDGPRQITDKRNHPPPIIGSVRRRRRQ